MRPSEKLYPGLVKMTAAVALRTLYQTSADPYSRPALPSVPFD